MEPVQPSRRGGRAAVGPSEAGPRSRVPPARAAAREAGSGSSSPASAITWAIPMGPSTERARSSRLSASSAGGDCAAARASSSTRAVTSSPLRVTFDHPAPSRSRRWRAHGPRRSRAWLRSGAHRRSASSTASPRTQGATTRASSSSRVRLNSRVWCGNWRSSRWNMRPRLTRVDRWWPIVDAATHPRRPRDLRAGPRLPWTARHRGAARTREDAYGGRLTARDRAQERGTPPASTNRSRASAIARSAAARPPQPLTSEWRSVSRSL